MNTTTHVTFRRSTKHKPEPCYPHPADTTTARCDYSKSGCFLQPDPLLDGLNRYMYVQGNPVRYVDPSGLARHSGDDYDPAEFSNPNWFYMLMEAVIQNMATQDTEEIDHEETRADGGSEQEPVLYVQQYGQVQRAEPGPVDTWLAIGLNLRAGLGLLVGDGLYSAHGLSLVLFVGPNGLAVGVYDTQSTGPAGVAAGTFVAIDLSVGIKQYPRSPGEIVGPSDVSEDYGGVFAEGAVTVPVSPVLGVPVGAFSSGPDPIYHSGWAGQFLGLSGNVGLRGPASVIFCEIVYEPR